MQWKSRRDQSIGVEHPIEGREVVFSENEMCLSCLLGEDSDIGVAIFNAYMSDLCGALCFGFYLHTMLSAPFHSLAIIYMTNKPAGHFSFLPGVAVR